MKKLTVKKLLEFRNKSDKAKQIFVDNIKSNKIEVPSEGGGDYWISSVSAISNFYKERVMPNIDKKITQLQDKLKDSPLRITKDMHQRNIDILKKYKTYDYESDWPLEKIEFLKKSTANTMLTIKGLQLEVKPNHIFILEKDETKYVGAIWFVAKLKGYKIEEIGVFTEALNKFLKNNFEKKYELNPNYCITVDIVNGISVNYSNIINGEITDLLNSTLDEINKLM